MLTHPITIDEGTRASRILKCMGLPTYQVISHIWEEGVVLIKTHEILINGYSFPVTANIYHLLHRRLEEALRP